MSVAQATSLDVYCGSRGWGSPIGVTYASFSTEGSLRLCSDFSSFVFNVHSFTSLPVSSLLNHDHAFTATRDFHSCDQKDRL